MRPRIRICSNSMQMLSTLEKDVEVVVGAVQKLGVAGTIKINWVPSPPNMYCVIEWWERD